MQRHKAQVGNRIRLEKGWTQERLAAEAEISVQQLRALEKGRQRNLGVDRTWDACRTIIYVFLVSERWFALYDSGGFIVLFYFLLVAILGKENI